MDFFNLITTRQSVRKYSARAVEPDKLNCILEAADRAPSAGNYQAFEIYVVRGSKRQQELAAASFSQDFIAQAPLSLVFCINPARCQYSPPETWALVDATIACTFAMLAATAVGLATCWIGAFSPEKVAQVIGCPAGIVPVAVLPAGYADEQPERTTRRPLSDLVHEV
ncbi:MAG: nitroreductase family protein [Terriglobales bacterium]